MTARLPDAIRAAALDRYRCGETTEAVAAALGLNKSTVGQWVTAAGIARPRGHRPDEIGLTGGSWRFDPFRRVQIWVRSIA